MTTVGFIGGGRIAATVARLSVAAGHRVVLSDPHGSCRVHGSTLSL
jgi:phosphoglycerate dehydrogenase-like enzyme